MWIHGCFLQYFVLASIDSKGVFLILQVHWLKTDFNKWRDEDDSDVEEGQDMQLEEVSADGQLHGGGGGAARPAGGGP